MLKKILHTTSLKANIIANFTGNAWAAVIGLIFVPIYLRYIGPEGYGLIGIFASLQVVLSLLDSGLSTTLNKELATLSARPGKEQQMHNLVRTLGTVYWAVATAAGVIAILLSPFLAKYWVQPKELSVETITYAFLLLSVSVVFQFPIGFYSGGLLGLQRQVMLNILKVLFATLKSVGVLLVLIFVSKSVIAFFSWTLLVCIVQAFTYKYVLRYYLPAAQQKAIFDKQELKNIWRFAAGMTAVGLTGILLTQADKIILSKILPLEQFGYYTFAFTVGSISYMIVGPISQSYFPRFSVLLSEGKIDELKKIYHQGCRLVTLLVIPFATLLALFSKEILFIWTHNAATVENSWAITSVVTVAVAIHCFMFIPYMLCLAYSNTKLALYTNIAILTLLIPGIIFSAIHFGAIGGAVCWLCINVVYLCVNPIIIHRLFLKGEAFNWYWNDTIKPALGCVALFIAVRYFLWGKHFADLTVIAMLALLGMIGFVITLLSSKGLKDGVWERVKILLVNKGIIKS